MADLQRQVDVLSRELKEANERQTATAEVLQVISSSLNDLKPVFESIGQRAEKLCNAEISAVTMLNDHQVHLVSIHGTTEEGTEAAGRAYPMRRDDETLTARAIRSATICHIPDVLSDPLYQSKDTARAAKYRAALAVPMIREGEVIGAIFVARQQPGLFTDAQIQLLKTFADQAVIAIETARLFNETQEALERQTATADILKVIASSPSDVQPVFNAVVSSAAVLFAPCAVTITTLKEDKLHWNAHATLQADADLSGTKAIYPIPFDPDRSASARAILERRVIEILDADAQGTPELVRRAAAAGHFRSAVYVPLIHIDKGVGAIILGHPDAGYKLSRKQLALVQAFADQAVIAIENARLFNETQEALERQTATSEVLQVISSSPGELEPVFQTMLEKAVRICDATFGNIYRWDGDALHLVSSHNTPPAYAEYRRRSPMQFDEMPESMRQMIETRLPVQTDPLAALDHEPNNTIARAGVELGGIRTVLNVPMMKEKELVGAFIISRSEVRVFNDKQLALVMNFARQAAIAIENARLLNELQQRTEALGQSVGELRALGEVSQAVNSTLDLETVLSTIVAKAVQLSNTHAGAIYVFDDAQCEFHLRATYGMDQGLIDTLESQHIGIDETNVATALARHEPTQIADLRAEAPNPINEITVRAGYRARLVAPLLRGEDVIGLLVVRRRTPGAFPQNTVDLMKTFAAQSALAIENARLFKNVETSLEDLRTTQDRLVQTEKLASLGQLTAGIAHEIKNPLNFVNNFSALSAELTDELNDLLKSADLAGDKRKDVDELTALLKDNLGKVVQHGKRADSIVKNMLLHSRERTGERRSTDVNALVGESLNLAYHGARAENASFSISLKHDLDPQVGAVELYPQEITRALLNLISNGFYAANKRRVEAGNDEVFEPVLRAATRNLGKAVEIRIRDNGTGIPPEVREKMFNPFFSTKPTGEGTGLGLSMTHDIIVKQHGGRIDVETEPGIFTEVIITLPRDNGTVVDRRP